MNLNEMEGETDGPNIDPIHSWVENEKAELVKLRYFVGLTIEEAAGVLRISEATAKRWWIYSRAWLYAEVRPPSRRSPARFSFFSSCPDTPGSRWGGEKRRPPWRQHINLSRTEKPMGFTLHCQRR